MPNAHGGVAPIGFHGTWITHFGRLAAEQDGDVVRGSYAHQDGHIEGRLEGAVVRGRWTQNGNGKAGEFEFRLDSQANDFVGSWRYDGDTQWRGGWNGMRLELPGEHEGGSPGTWNSQAEGPLLAGPMVGEVGEDDARIWVQARASAPLTLTVEGPSGEAICEQLTPRWSDWLCATFVVEGLEPGTTYSYSIEGPDGATAPQRLRTAPPRDARKAIIPFGSCFWNWSAHELPIFDSIANEGGDLFLMLGDNCYYGDHDWQTEHTMTLAQLRHRNNESFRRLAEGTSVIAIWDDHDFGPNDVTGHFPGKARSLAAFKRVWAQRSFGVPGLAGVFSTVRCGPVEIFLLDERYRRAMEGKNILGHSQLDWLFEKLDESDAPVKLIASASQVLPEHPVRNGWDSFRRDAPEELEAILAHIEQNDIQGVVFVSGDLHMANLMYCEGRAIAAGRGPDFWELTTSPLANEPWNQRAGADRYLMREVIDRTNYGVLDVDLDRSGEEIILVLKDEHGGTLLQQPIALDTLRVR